MFVSGFSGLECIRRVHRGRLGGSQLGGGGGWRAEWGGRGEECMARDGHFFRGIGGARETRQLLRFLEGGRGSYRGLFLAVSTGRLAAITVSLASPIPRKKCPFLKLGIRFFTRGFTCNAHAATDSGQWTVDSGQRTTGKKCGKRKQRILIVRGSVRVPRGWQKSFYRFHAGFSRAVYLLN